MHLSRIRDIFNKNHYLSPYFTLSNLSTLFAFVAAQPCGLNARKPIRNAYRIQIHPVLSHRRQYSRRGKRSEKERLRCDKTKRNLLFRSKKLPILRLSCKEEKKGLLSSNLRGLCVKLLLEIHPERLNRHLRDLSHDFLMKSLVLYFHHILLSVIGTFCLCSKRFFSTRYLEFSFLKFN